MSVRLIVFFLGVTITVIALSSYVSARIAELARLGPRGRRTVLAVLLAAVLTPFALRFMAIELDDGARRAIASVGFVIALAVVLGGLALLPIDLVSSVARRLARRSRAVRPTVDRDVREPAPAPAIPEQAPELGRRALIRRAGIGAALTFGAGTSLYGVLIGRRDYVVEDVPIPIRGLPRALEGYTIVQLSDLHIGTFVGDHELDAAIELVRRARPDRIVLTGDLLDHDARHAPTLGRFARRLDEIGARDGVTAIAGNHDYYAGIEVVLGTLRAAGVDVLRNDARTIGERGRAIALLGVDDVWAPRNGYGPGADLDAAIARAPRDAPRILLCHNPEYFEHAAPHIDLMLSGHTHGGQVNLGISLAQLALRHGLLAGHYQRDGSQIYVNRGFGTVGPPARVGAPPEISRIVLIGA
jgi:predicted MPP superfamily phosphohydrolase